MGQLCLCRVLSLPGGCRRAACVPARAARLGRPAMAETPRPAKKVKVDAFAALRNMATERKRKEAAEAQEKASKPLPAPKPRGPVPKDLKQRPKTWDPLGGAIDTIRAPPAAIPRRVSARARLVNSIAPAGRERPHP